MKVKYDMRLFGPIIPYYPTLPERQLQEELWQSVYSNNFA